MTNEFAKDNNWQRQQRDRWLKPFYNKLSFEGRYVFCDKGQLADILQRELAVDTILQKSEGYILAVEEKIVRWPGYEYTAFVFETMSCTVPDRERKGWMYTAKCDVLLYCFTQADDSLIAYAIPFSKLQSWFFKDNRYEAYRSTRTEQINQTECRIVPIKDVLAAISETKLFRMEKTIDITPRQLSMTLN